MDESYTPPRTNGPTSDEREANAAEAAEAARRVMNPTSNKVGLALAGGALLLGGAVIGQAVSNEVAHNDRVASVTAEYQHNQDILEQIKSESVGKVDPANVVGVFDIKDGATVNQLSINIVSTQPEYMNGDEATQDWIEFAILESGKAQGSYDNGDVFVVSHTEINGKDTFIVQDGSTIEYPTPPMVSGNAIPSPDTH